MSAESEASRSARVGLIQGVGAYALWGAMPLYFLAMRPAGAFEIVAWRVVFSLAFCALLLAAGRGWRRLAAVLRGRRTVAALGLAGALIWVNWVVYVLATTSGHVVEAALGYFINPILTVLLGVVLLRERLRPLQWAAVGLSAIAVLVLTVEAGAVPWISLALAASFGLYGLIKKRIGAGVDVVSGLVVETAWLTPVAAVQVGLVATSGSLAFGVAGAGTTMLLVSSGVGTAVPLLLFAAAARRLPLSVVGFVQYLTPVLQFALGVLVLHEPMPVARLIGFCIVWAALVLLVGESAAHRRRVRRRPPVIGAALGYAPERVTGP